MRHGVGRWRSDNVNVGLREWARVIQLTTRGLVSNPDLGAAAPR